MTAAAPWSVKGINPKAREVAKDLARRSGMTLGEWLNRVILEDDVPEEVTSEAHFGIRPRRALSETPKSHMARPPLSSGPPYRPEFGRSEPGNSEAGQSDEFGRIAFALDRLTDRIEASETRTGLAISGVEHSVRHAMARIESAEHEHMAAAARVDNTSERLRRMESEPAGPRSAEALKALEARVEQVEARADLDPAAQIEAVVNRLGERLSLAEGRTGEALECLRGSLAELDQRIGFGDRGDLDLWFAALADQLTRRVEDARAEIAERLLSAGPDQIEARLGEMSGQLAAAERRSAQAIEAMGREVLTMAETLNRRVQSAEQRSARAIEQVGGEIARIAGAVEQRLGHSDELHGAALERLGAEIARITERLTDRIIQSERRAAQAIDDVGDQVSKVTERIEQRHERASSDIAERIRQSEVRTAQLLDQARLRLQPKGDESAAACVADAAPAPDTTFTPAPGATEAPATLAEPPSVFGAALSSRAEPLNQPALDPIHPAFGDEDFEAADRFAPIADPHDESGVTEPVLSGAEPLSTREVIEQARAAARAAQPPASKGTRAPPAARRDERPRKSGLFARRPMATGLFQTLKDRPLSTWQTALMVAGGAAFLSVGAAGVVLLEGPGAHRQAAIALPVGAPRAAVALSAPIPMAVATDASDTNPDTGPKATEFLSVTHAVEQGAPGALARLKALAEADYGPAQMYLGKLYETGRSGVSINAAEARRWTARAAENGEAPAMHNLAMYLYEGEGGIMDKSAAAGWFKKAAERGVTDSQYNLAMLYQSGSGAERDLAQAYRWFSVAAQRGDVGARAAAVALKPQLTAAQVSAAETLASRFEPVAAAPTSVSAQAEPQLSSAAAQRILGRLGYYKARPGGSTSRDLKLAVTAYQRDQGLVATGALDAPTATRLAVFTR